MTLEEIKRGETGRLEFKREVLKHEGVAAVGIRVGNVGNLNVLKFNPNVGGN